MQAQDRYFVSGGSRLRYRDEGGGDAAVFIHGWTLDLEVWNPQAQAFARSMRVIRLDRRGFGLSQGSPSLDGDCDDLVALLDWLQVPTATLVGASQGARVALATALRSPERVRGVVLDGPPDEIEGDGAGDNVDLSLEEFRDQVRSQGLEAFRRSWRAHPLMRLHSADPAARDLVAVMLERYPARDLVEAAERRAPPLGAAAIARMRKPALVVNGEFDTAVRQSAGERLCRTLPDAQRLVVPRAGHLPSLDNPGAYNDALASFFRGRSRAAA